MRNALDAIPAEARSVIIEELSNRDPVLLEELRSTGEPTIDQRDAVNELLATAVINNMGHEWEPNTHGLAVEARSSRVQRSMAESYMTGRRRVDGAQTNHLV